MAAGSRQYQTAGYAPVNIICCNRVVATHFFGSTKLASDQAKMKEFLTCPIVDMTSS